jgi:hypothetical protein
MANLKAVNLKLLDLQRQAKTAAMKGDLSLAQKLAAEARRLQQQLAK